VRYQKIPTPSAQSTVVFLFVWYFCSHVDKLANISPFSDCKHCLKCHLKKESRAKAKQNNLFYVRISVLVDIGLCISHWKTHICQVLN